MLIFPESREKLHVNKYGLNISKRLTGTTSMIKGSGNDPILNDSTRRNQNPLQGLTDTSKAMAMGLALVLKSHKLLLQTFPFSFTATCNQEPIKTCLDGLLM